MVDINTMRAIAAMLANARTYKAVFGDLGPGD